MRISSHKHRMKNEIIRLRFIGFVTFVTYPKKKKGSKILKKNLSDPIYYTNIYSYNM